MRLYLITHAHTVQDPSVAADAWRLSTRGVQEAAQLADAPFWEGVSRIVLSSEQKTWLTVEAVANARKLPVWIDCRFDELRRTGWSENYAAQVAAAFEEPEKSSGGWEPVARLRVRALEGLRDLQRRFTHENVALVGHGICLSVLRAFFLGCRSLDYRAWQRLTFASVAVAATTPPALVQDFIFSDQAQR